MRAMGKAGFGLAVGLVFLTSPCPGEILEFRDKDEWVAAVGDYTTIDFTGFADTERITDQYADLGVLFTDCYITFDLSYDLYPNDWWGVDGNQGIHIEFAEPQLWLATEFPGALKYELYRDGELIFESLPYGGAGPGLFAGIICDIAFDEALIYDDYVHGNANIDDLHFGVPGPASLPLISLALLVQRRSRT